MTISQLEGTSKFASITGRKIRKPMSMTNVLVIETAKQELI
jgi:hypothetical protein